MGAPTWPLVGRDEELDLIAAALGKPSGAGVVLAGAAGVGKTRLARDALALAATGGDTVEFALASRSAATIPLGALLPLLGDLAVEPRQDRFVLYRDAARALVARAGDTRLVLAVDDAHLLDEGSAALLAQLVTTPQVALVLTVRTGERAPDAVTGLWKDGVLERLEVQALSDHDVGNLVELVVGGPIEHDTRRRLCRRCGGNVLLLRELVVDALEGGALAPVDGLWTWARTHRPGTRLVEVVAARLGNLSDEDRALVELVAVGEPLELAAVDSLLPGAPVVDAERRGLIAVDRSGDTLLVRLPHPLYGEIVRDRLPRPEHDRLCAALSARLVHPSGPEQTLRRATWLLESGARGEHPAYCQGAEVANELFDHELAERLARAALADGDSFPASLALGEALNGLGRPAEAEAVLAPLTSYADENRVRVVDQRIQALFWGLGDFERADRVLVEAGATVRQPEWRAYLEAERANLLTGCGRITEGLALALPLFDDPQVDERVRLRTINSVVIGSALVGQTARAVRAAEEATEPAIRLQRELPRATSWVMAGLLIALVLHGDLDRADAVLDLADPDAAAGAGSFRGNVQLFRGRIALSRGRVRTAAALLRQAAASLRTAGSGRFAWCVALLAEAEALSGNGAAGERALAEATAADVLESQMFAGDIAVAGAWVAASRGELTAADEGAVGAADSLARLGHHGAELLARHDALRLGRTDQAPAIAAVAARVDSAWAPACAAHATALVAGDGRGLEDAAAAFEVIGARLVAAECRTQAARAYADAGLRARATAAAGAAQRLLAACEGARTPILRAPSDPAPLTRREREVATLAAGGATNREIADRLHLNVRTVEGHLYQAYAKLGVRRRGDLGAALGLGASGGTAGSHK